MIGDLQAAMLGTPEISVVVPMHNEEGSVEELARQLRQALPEAHEVIFVDDGSTDRTWPRLLGIHDPDRVRVVKLRVRSGKSAALMAGFARCKAPVVFTLDGDLQDDPAEIPKFLSKLAEGHDLVSGWKRVRHDPLHKVAASRVFNFVMRHATGLQLRDMNCGFKCYRSEVVKRLRIHGDQHRFIPVFAADAGFSVAEVEVRHRPRVHGRSKYGLSRMAKGFADLGTVLLRTRYKDRPAHGFGLLAIAAGVSGIFLLLLSAGRFLPGLAAFAAEALGAALVVCAPVLIAAGWVAEFLLHCQAVGRKPELPEVEQARD